ncbi:MAG: hypothetical protein HOP19_00820 [Acidobacteria bacterium]|nr:hypothetical protein [Acidobacteriota bacterium]
MSVEFGGFEYGSEGGVALCAPFGAEAVSYFAVDDGGAQRAFASIVGRWHFRFCQEDQQVVAVFDVPLVKLLRRRTRLVFGQ